MALDTQRLEKNLRRLRKLIRKAPKRPTPENIHDLRTYTRRFEAASAALKLDSRNERRLLRGLPRARKRAGKIRDMDVLTSYASGVDAGGQQDCKVQLLEYLGARRYRQAKRLRQFMSRGGSLLRRRLKRTSTRLNKIIATDSRGASAGQNAAPADAMASAVKLSRELGSPALLNRTNLHPYRLKVKELRYVLQMAASPDTYAFIDSLGAVKDAIGQWHDWEELIAITVDLDEHGPNCKLIRELKTISEHKYDHALALTKKMRSEYLRGVGATRKQVSIRRLRPAPPAMRAISGIAS